MAKSKIMIIEKLYMNNQKIGYFVFDYSSLNFKTIESLSGYDVWGKDGKELPGYKNIPWHDIHEGYLSERCAVVLGRGKNNIHTIIYFIMGYGVYIDVDSDFLQKIKKNGIRCINIKDANYVCSRYSVFPEIDLNTIKYKKFNNVSISESMFTDDLISKIKDKQHREKLLNEKYMAKLVEIEDKKSIPKTLTDRKNKEFAYRFVTDANIYLADKIGDRLLDKKTLAKANYYIAPSMLLEDIRNFRQYPCTEALCKEIIKKCTNILNNNTLSETEQLKEIRNTIESVDDIGRSNDFCQFCDSMLRIVAAAHFSSPQNGGVTLFNSSENFYINSESVNRLELRYFYVIMHEYLHLITKKDKLSGISNIDSPDWYFLNIINEGITDIFAGYLTYYCCKNLYERGKNRQREFYFYENDKILDIKEIENRTSPFLKDLKFVKDFKTIPEVLVELKQGNLNLEYLSEKIYEGPYYSNVLIVYFLMKKFGISTFYRAYFNNDVAILEGYLNKRIPNTWSKLKNKLNNLTNGDFVDKMLLVDILSIMEKAGL